MDLTLQDKNELLKAAVRTTDRGIADWLVSLVERFDGLAAEGKRNIPCPPYAPAATRVVFDEPREMPPAIWDAIGNSHG